MQHTRRALAIATVFITILAGILAACSDDDDADMPADEATQATNFAITSAVFNAGTPIPGRYTCNGDDVSPPLSLSDHPEDTESIVLIVDDPDAPNQTWVHWVVFNLPGDTTMIPEAVTSTGDLPGTPVQGQNSWGRSDYGGPCPPSGEHRYFFKAYALDTTLDLDADATKANVVAAMDGHILAQAELIGTYEQQPNND